MADCRRKNVKNFPRLNNCRINPEAFAVINRLAGHRSMGAAVEDLVAVFLTVQASKRQKLAATN